MVNDNRAAWLHDDNAFGGMPQRARSVINDQRGYVAELAAKAVDAAALGDPVSAEDREHLRAFLKACGALDHDLTYRGSPRSGYVEPPGVATQSGTLYSPRGLRQLMRCEFWNGPRQFGEGFSQAATMPQPVRACGRVGEALSPRLGFR